MANDELVDDLEVEADEEEYDPDAVMIWTAEQFSSALMTVPERPMHRELGLCRVTLEPGIQRPIEYSDDVDNFLEARHGYTAWIRGKSVEISLHLYENIQGFHRLFAYTRQGMLFSVNLTLGREGDRVVHLAQQLRIGSGSASDRQAGRDELVVRLRALRFDVDEKNVVDLGDVDPETGTFQCTTAERFLKDYLAVAILKGHFMGNKRYSSDCGVTA